MSTLAPSKSGKILFYTYKGKEFQIRRTRTGFYTIPQVANSDLPPVDKAKVEKELRESKIIRDFIAGYSPLDAIERHSRSISIRKHQRKIQEKLEQYQHPDSAVDWEAFVKELKHEVELLSSDSSNS